MSSGTTRSQIVADFINLTQFDAVQGNSITAVESTFPKDTTPIVLGGFGNTTGYRPLFTGLAQYTYLTVEQTNAPIQSGFVWFVATDANGNITGQCPINFNVASHSVQIEQAGQSSNNIVCTVANGAISNYGNISVSFYVTFSTSAPGNYTIMGSATDSNGLTSPWTTLGTWGLSTPNTNPTPTFTLNISSSQTFPITLVPVSPNGGPDVVVSIQVNGQNSFNCPVTFTSLTSGILASGTGGTGTVGVALSAISAGATTVELSGSSSNCGAGPAEGAYLSVPINSPAPPATTTQTITSNPLGQGLTVIVDGYTCNTPCAFQWPANAVHTISVPTTETALGTQYSYSSWSDGGAQSHQITVGWSAATYTANFTSITTPLQSSSQAISVGGVASFQVYISQYNPALTATLSVANYAGGGWTVNPSTVTGSGWATVLLNGSTPSTTPYGFTVLATMGSLSASVAGTVMVNPTSASPDFTLSTTTPSITLAPNVAISLPVAVGAVAGGTGTLTFTSDGASGVTVSGSSSAGLTATLAPGYTPTQFRVIGTDSAHTQHYFYANCNPQPGPSENSPSAELPAGTYANVQIGASAVTYGYFLVPNDDMLLDIRNQNCCIPGAPCPGSGLTAWSAAGNGEVNFQAAQGTPPGIYAMQCYAYGYVPIPLTGGVTVYDPAPVIRSVTPASLAAGQSATILINGQNFGLAGNVTMCLSGGCFNPSTTSWSAGAVTASVDGSYIATPGNYTVQITVTRDAGGFPFQTAQGSAGAGATSNAYPLPAPSICLQSVSFSANQGSLAQMYVDSPNWQQDSIASNGTTLIQGQRWADSTCGAGSTFSYPLAYTYGAQPAMYDVLLNTGIQYVGSAVLHIVSDQPSLLSFPDRSINFNGNVPYNVGGTGAAMISTPLLPSVVTSQVVHLAWMITFAGSSTPTTFATTTHTILVIPGAPVIWNGDPNLLSNTPQNVTAARLNYVVNQNQVAGQSSAGYTAYQIATNISLLVGGHGASLSLGSSEFNGINHNPWVVLAQPPPPSMDCYSQTTLALVQALQVGVNASIGSAYATSDFDATAPEFNGPLTLGYVGDTGNVYPFEGFLYICDPQTSPWTPCTQQSVNILAALTVWTLQGPFGLYPNGNWPQSSTISSAYYAATFNAIYFTLEQALHYSGPDRSPNAGQQWWFNCPPGPCQANSTTMVQQQFFPVELP